MSSGDKSYVEQATVCTALLSSVQKFPPVQHPTPCASAHAEPLCARRQDAVKSAAGYVQDTVRLLSCCSYIRAGAAPPPQPEYVPATSPHAA